VHTGFNLKLEVPAHGFEIQAVIFLELGGDGRKYATPVN
jgi:hypothetical protein